MATTRPKEVGATGKEKKIPSSNSHVTNTKKTTKPSTTNSSTEKATSTQSEKQIPNYLKPTISSRLESQSFKHRKSDAPQRPNLDRRRSLENPPSASRLPKETHTSHPSLHKAGVCPGPRERTVPLRSSSFSVKGTTSSKPISERTSKIPRDGKTHQPLLAKSVRKSSSTSSSTTKKVADDGSARSTNRVPKSAGTEAAETENVEAEQEVKEATNEEVEEVYKVEDEERLVDSGCAVPPHDENSEHELEVSDDHQPQVEADDDEKVIPTVSEEEEEEANAVVEVEEAKEEEPREEKAEDEHDEEENTNQHETSINDESHREKQPEVVEAEAKEEGGITEEQDQTGNNTNEEELALEEKEEGISKDKVELKEGQEEVDEHVESDGVKEAKKKPTETQQQKGSGKSKESQTQNDVIEEAASTLLARKNKVRALAGAFQTVIDHQFK